MLENRSDKGEARLARLLEGLFSGMNHAVDNRVAALLGLVETEDLRPVAARRIREGGETITRLFRLFRHAVANGGTESVSPGPFCELAGGLLRRETGLSLNIRLAPDLPEFKASPALLFDALLDTAKRIPDEGFGVVVLALTGEGGRVRIRVGGEPGGGGQGVVFWEADYPAAFSGRTEPVTRTGQAPATVLVVDDEAFVRNLATRMLERMGHETVSAASCLAARKILAETETVACVLLDLNMPGTDGATCMTALREISPGIPVVIVSGYVESGDKAVEGADACLGKPFGLEELDRVVREVMERRIPLENR